MAFKGTSNSVVFRERRADFATRISSRGHGFEFSSSEALNAPMRQQITDMLAVLAIAVRESEKGNQDAVCQVNRLRGQLGNIRKMLVDPHTYKTADIFMTVARHVLPQEMFDALLSETRAMRDTAAIGLIHSIDDAMGTPKDRPVTFETRLGRKLPRGGP